MTDLGLQAAVPKSQKLQLQGISSSELDGGEEATQQMRIISVQGVSCIWNITTEACAKQYIAASSSKVALEIEGELCTSRQPSHDRTGGLVRTSIESLMKQRDRRHGNILMNNP